MEWGGRREEGSGWGTHVYLWWIHFDVWQNKYIYLNFKNKIKLKKKLIKKKKKKKTMLGKVQHGSEGYCSRYVSLKVEQSRV